MSRRPWAVAAAIIAIFVAMPRSALACPVCFGASDAPMAVATNMGIIAMLVVVVGVLGAFASFFIYLMRRAKIAARLVEKDRNWELRTSEEIGYFDGA
jgi:hypothetical protein